MKIKQQFAMMGHYHFVALPAISEMTPKEKIEAYKLGMLKPFKIGKEINNLIVFSDENGLDLILRQLKGDETFSININYASIGTGTTPVTEADTAMEVETLGSIVRATSEISDGQLMLEFFITDGELENGSYTELGLFCGGQMFAHSIINPAYEKGSLQDTLIQYTIGISNQ
jgi:hypothetical protein